MKRSDISDYEILNCIKEQKDTPDIILGNRYPIKVIMAKMEQLYNKGYLECGVSIRTAWLTEKGKEYLRGLEEMKGKNRWWNISDSPAEDVPPLTEELLEEFFNDCYKEEPPEHLYFTIPYKGKATKLEWIWYKIKKFLRKEVKNMDKKYKVIAFLRVEAEDDEGYDTIEEAQAELEQAQLMQPENIYQILEVKEVK